MSTLKAIVALFALFISFQSETFSQTHAVTGIVIAEDLLPLPQVDIWTGDHKLAGKTRMDGHFDINIPDSAKTLIFKFLGYENTITKLYQNCNTVEVILLSAGTYDFMSSRKIERARLRQFRTLPKLYLKAFDSGVFTNKSICYSAEFTSQKARMDSIREETLKQKKRAARPPAFEKN